MKRISTIITATVATIALSSCDTLYFKGMVAPEGENADGRFAQSIEYCKSAGKQSVTADSDNYRLYVITDTHIENNVTSNLDKFTSVYLADRTAAPFMLCLGDLQNGKGDFSAFASHTAAIGASGRRMFVSAGNHDLYWGRWNLFRETFKTSTYTFEAITPNARDLFICLESGGGTLGNAQTEWLKETLKNNAASYRHVIVFTHTHFFMKDLTQGHTSNFPVEETYALAQLFSENGVKLVISGHDHTREETSFKGVQYVIVDALEEIKPDAGYAIFTIGEEIKTEFLTIN